MMSPGTRVMIFKDGDVWLAAGVDVSHVLQGASLEDLAVEWQIIAACYVKEYNKYENKIWEPPIGTEYESVWETGEPCEFVDGLEARIIDKKLYELATKEYMIRYKSYGLGLTKEEQEEWDKVN